MNDNNYNPQVNQNNPNIINNTENLQPIIGENLSQNNNSEAPKNNKILIIVVVFIVLVIFGLVWFLTINKKPKSNSNSKSSKETISNIPFASEKDKKYIDETNKQYGIRFNNQVVLVNTVRNDGSIKTKVYDGSVAVAIDVSECHHVSIDTPALLTCYLDKAGKDYYGVVVNSNNLGAFNNFGDIVNKYKKQSYGLTFKGIAYGDVNVYSRWHNTAILHLYFGHLIPGQYTPYFYVAFNKGSTEKDKSYNSEANVDMYYKKISIINVPNQVTE